MKKGQRMTEEQRRKLSEAHLTSPKAIAHRARLHETMRGKSHSEERKRKHRESPKWQAHMARLRELNLGKEATEEARHNLSVAGRTSPKAIAHRARLHELTRERMKTPEAREILSVAGRTSPKAKAQRSRLYRTHPSSLNAFMLSCFAVSNHRFEAEAEIPGFFELAGRHHAFDFLLREKRLAVELDGTYWHPARPQRDFAWDCNREADQELYAALLGWRVIRIPERVLKASKPYQKWVREQKQEQREIQFACKPPRLHINLATKAVHAKAAHFERVRLRKAT